MIWNKFLKKPSNEAESLSAASAEALEAGDKLLAMEYAAKAMYATPNDPVYKQRFIQHVKILNIQVFNADVKNLFTFCLSDRTIDHGPLYRPWLGSLKLDPDFIDFFACAAGKTYEEFAQAFPALPNHDALFDPYFLLGLYSLGIPNMEFEIFMTYLRRFTLEHFNMGEAGSDNPDYYGLMGAMAAYGMHTEYAFYVSESEREKLKTLKSYVAQNGQEDIFSILLLMCYEPLYTIESADILVKELQVFPALKELLQIHYYEPLDERKIRKTISALTPIDNEISQKVREQYEEFPYPRWTSLSPEGLRTYYKRTLSDDLLSSITQPGSKFLIAGCGTSQGVECAVAFPEADVLAIDLSLTSMAYSKRKMKDYDIKKLTFRQADILALDQVDMGSFDFIMSGGVLHHLVDPEAGWRILADKLKPGGLMYIALYSEIGRQFVVRARKMIAELGYRSDADGIRRFRHESGKLFSAEDLAIIYNSSDFYSLSECRDLFFHEQEHRFTIPQIEKLLEKLGLTFLKFDIDPNIIKIYQERYPDDPQALNFENWDRLEHEYPEMFIQMYRFWCKK